MKRWAVALVASLCVGAVALAACGGGGDGDPAAQQSGLGPPSSAQKTANASKSKTPGASGTANGTNSAGTPGANGTAASGTAAAGGPPGAGETPGAEGTPRPVETIVGSGNTPVASSGNPTPTNAEQFSIGDGGEIPEDIIGGDPNKPPEVYNDLPEPPAGATIDPPTIADPNPGVSDIQLIIDLNASEPGIQSTRTVKVGDVLRVGLVMTNVPDFVGTQGGLAAFDLRVNYDTARIVAPTIIGGSSLARNPDLNEEALGTGPDGWSCLLPAPQGDADDPGGPTGDGDPATGEAFISCFGTPPIDYRGGNLVFATIQFQALASGTTAVGYSTEGVNFFDSLVTSLGSCGDLDPVIPCRSATLTVE